MSKLAIFTASTDALSARMVVEKICLDNDVPVDLSSAGGFGSQAGKLAELLGVEVWIALKMIWEANPWPNDDLFKERTIISPPGQSLRKSGDETTLPFDEDQIQSYLRFRRACLTMISIFDMVPERLLQTKPQPSDHVVQEFIQHALSQSVEHGSCRLLDNGSIVHSSGTGPVLKSPLLLRPLMKLLQGGILLPNLATAVLLRNRIKEIMIEAAERDNRRRIGVKK
uniref:Uncharacterized protein n=1 Tax=viral metagenome TaxID=1070528 RepID=A0A6C0CH44_9ZZZZ